MPGEDLPGDFRRRGNAVDRQGKRGFGDEGVTALDFKPGRDRIGSALVIAARDPDFPAALHANLRRTPGINVEIAGLAVETAFRQPYEF